MKMTQLKSKVISLYKNLLYYGRDYPAGYDYFRHRLKKAFIKNCELDNSAEIQKQLDIGEFVIKELDALYKLKKYRYLKKNYYDTVEEEKKLLEAQSANAAKFLKEYTKK